MHARRTPLRCFLVAAALACSAGAFAQPMGKTKEYVSLNTDFYKISIQKNGQVDVFLATDEPAMLDAFPMVWYHGQPAPVRIKTKGQWVERLASDDRLGQGQGTIHQHDGWEWSIRAYPTRPYFAVQLKYTNITKKPVIIKALLPWCVGTPGRGTIVLGPQTNDSRVLVDLTSGQPQVTNGAGRSNDAIAILNPANGRSLIAGFITADRALGWIDVANPIAELKKSPSALGEFRAATEFREPVTLAPGESLHSEVLYLAIAEPDPVVGVQRYARAVQVANNIASAVHDTPLHAWVISSAAFPDSAALAQRLESVRARVPLDLIGHILIHGDASGRISPEILDAVRAAGFTPVPANGTPVPGSLVVAGVTLDSDPRKAAAQVEALRAQLGEDARIFGAAPSFLAGALLDGVVTAATDQRFVTPQPARHAVEFGAQLSRADIAIAGLLGCGLLLPLPNSNDNPILNAVPRLLPSAAPGAHPVDLFGAEAPRLFHLQRKLPDGELHVIVLANRSASNDPVTLPFSALGLTPGAFYTVYDFGQRTYLGTARDQLAVPVPPGDAAALIFRPMLSHPMLVSTGVNLAQDTPALRRADWDPKPRSLTVELGKPSATPTRYSIAVPAPYRFLRSMPAGTDLAVSDEKTNVTLTLPTNATKFTIQFTTE